MYLIFRTITQTEDMSQLWLQRNDRRRVGHDDGTDLSRF